MKKKHFRIPILFLTVSLAFSTTVAAGIPTTTIAHEKHKTSTDHPVKTETIGLFKTLGKIKDEISKDRSAPKIIGLPDDFTIKQTKKSKKEPDKKPEKPDYLDGITAEDKNDGDRTSTLTVDDSEVDYFTPGEYFVYFTASDESGNKAREVVMVIVTDAKAPSIKIDGDYLTAKKKGDKSNYEEKIKIKDNVDSRDDIKVKIDDSKVDYTKYGTYTIKVTATDTSGNKNEKDFTVKIKDKKGPTIKVDKDSFTTVVGLQLDFTPNVTIKDGSGVADFCIDDSQIDYWTAGEYQLHITATDKKGNTSSKDIPVYVTDPEAEARAQEEAAQARAARVSQVTMYITNSGSKYHTSGCRHLRDSCIPISLADAEAQGYTPCGTCCR